MCKHLGIPTTLLAALAAICLSISRASALGYRVLYGFTCGPDGAYPLGSLVQSGNLLYGMDTSEVFSLDPTTRSFLTVHRFTGGPDDGGGPEGSLILSGQALYGMTNSGGSVQAPNGNYVYGALFALDTTTNAISILHSFAGGSSDGAAPHGTPILSGSVLYGMTGAAGAGADGTIFAYDTTTHGYSTLHSFAGAPTDGKFPEGSLLQFGNVLYGMSQLGGSANKGTIFSYELSTHQESLLHSFTGSSNDGATPHGSLIKSGNLLYGLTSLGGTKNLGTLFAFDPITHSTTLLHSFGEAAGDGVNPSGSLVKSGSVLYGMTPSGGDLAGGVVFAFDTSTTSYSILHDFDPGPLGSFADPPSSSDNYLHVPDGANPVGDLLLVGDTLYGMTKLGSGGYEYGTIFALTIPEPATVLLLSSTIAPLLLKRRSHFRH